MIKFRVTLRIAALAVLAIFATPTDLISCGPFLTTAVFVATQGPVDPRADYSRKYIGIVERSWRTEPLIQAWRYFSGLDLNRAELDQLYADRRISVARESDEAYGPLELWLAARKTIPNAPPLPQLYPYRNIHKADLYIGFENCLDDAFRNATATLNDRGARWGLSSNVTKDWLAAQDAVFSNCSGPPQQPAPAAPNAPQLLKADRAYQSAAALFYAGEYSAARDRFLAIAKDSASPWKPNAAYLAARCKLRDATVNGGQDKLAQAAKELTAIQSPAARRLLQFAENRLHPEDRLSSLVAQLSQPRIGPDPRQTFTDFLYLYIDSDSGKPKPSALRTPLTDWLSTWRNPPDAATAFANWRARGTLPWLIAALAQVEAKDAAAPELLEAAEKVSPSSPAFPSAAYYAAKISSPEEARRRVSQALATPLNDSDYNRLLAYRFTLANSFQDFQRDSPRKLSLYSVVDDTPSEIDTPNLAQFLDTMAFDSDSVVLWNRFLTLQQWLDAARGSVLPKNLRSNIARAGWVRATIQNRRAESLAFLRLWSRLDPAGAKPTRAYLRSPDKYTAAQIFLHNPGLIPDVENGFGRLTKPGARNEYRVNWWCASKPPQEIHTLPAFLPREPVSTVAQSASGFIPTEIVRYARAHPDDPAVPEALYRSLDVAHYSLCDSTDNGVPSRQAFQLLKSKYAATKWARETKYWYK